MKIGELEFMAPMEGSNYNASHWVCSLNFPDKSWISGLGETRVDAFKDLMALVAVKIMHDNGMTFKDMVDMQINNSPS